MKQTNRCLLWTGVAVAFLCVSLNGQIYRYYNPGTVWTVTALRVKQGMDPAYLGYLDGQFKKEHEALVKAKLLKSYKILRDVDDDMDSWNVLILREYQSLVAMESGEEKEDAIRRQIAGDDEAQMKGYEDRSKVREVLWIKTTRELMLK